MNHEARIETVEVKLSSQELNDFTALCKSLGNVAKSAFLRGLINNQVRTHGMPAAQQKESRNCPGNGRMANRSGAARNGMRRHL